jgi:filamentous hemagglutinin family protein
MTRSIFKRDWYWQLLVFLPVITSNYWTEGFVLAQIVPDSSLGNEASKITPNATVKNNPAALIEGGALRGGNLFHSFSEFNIGEGQRVYFASPQGIANIFSRITGGNPSEILGQLGVNGNASLFFLNPNGIFFGQNSSLDLAGSFLATTADSFVFPNDFAFSASNPDAPPLLTVSVPIGVQFGTKAESIVNRSQSKKTVEINGQSYELIFGLQVSQGKSLALVGGKVVFEGGVVVASASRVELGAVEQNSFVGLQPTEKGWSPNYQDVKSFQDIKFTANTLALGANIDISDLDFNNPSKIAGNIQIQGRNIVFEGGSQINAVNYVTTSGGSILINASESVQIIGTGDPFPSYISYGTVGDGKGGNIEINTKKLLLQDGGSIFVDAAQFTLDKVKQPLGSGQAGEIIINATELVELVGEGTTISGSTSNLGNAGNIEIKTNRLIVKDGATIEAATSPKSSIFPDLASNGGSILIDAREIDLLNGGKITVNSQSTGRGGDIIIDTELLKLENRGQISAESFSGNGGNILLTVGNLLAMRQQSTISTSAGEEMGGGDGGNIIVKARFVLAVPEEDSDISANAFEGNGGNITIASENLFGISYREEDTSLSDITAFSRNKFALNGTVIINSPDINSSQYLNKIAAKSTTPQLLQGCQAGNNLDSRFVNIGRGGSPVDPYEPISSQEIVEDLRLPKYWSQSVSFNDSEEKMLKNEDGREIVEAKGIQRDDRGNVVLVGEIKNSFACR